MKGRSTIIYNVSVRALRAAAFFCAAAWLLMPAVSCERRPLADQSYNVYLDLEIEDEITNYELESLPEVRKVNFYDPQTEALMYEDFVGPQGGDLSVPPGTYHMVVYNFGTESTVIGRESQHSQVVAYTNEISDFIKGQMQTFLAKRASLHATKNDGVEDEKIVNQPDHLLVSIEQNVEVPVQAEGDRQHVIHTTAETVVETYKITVRDIKGGQYIRSVSALISGMVRSHYIGADVDSDMPATIYFDMYTDDTRTVLNGTFNTFGKHPGVESVLTLDLLVVDTGGGEHIFSYDITDQFKDNEDHVLEVIGDFEVREPAEGGGGLAPDVDDWDDVNTDIII